MQIDPATILPLRDFILVLLDTPEEKMGSLYLPDQAQKSEYFKTGVIVSGGPEARDAVREIPNGPGYRVMVSLFAGTDFERPREEGESGKVEKYCLCRAEDLVGVFQAQD